MAKADIDEAVARLLVEEERRGEYLANRLGLGIATILAVVLLLNYLGGALLGEQALFAAVGLVVFAVTTWVTLRFLQRGRFHPAFKYVTSVQANLLLTGYLFFSTLQVPTTPFMASISWVYMALIALAGLRHQVRLVVTTGVLSTVGFTAVGAVSLNMLAADPLPPRVAHHATVITLLTRDLYLLGTTALLTYSAMVARRMHVQSARAQLERLQAVAQLNRELEERIRAYSAELRGGYVHQVRMAERLRLAREMHDGLAASLSSLALQAEVIVHLLRSGSEHALKQAEAVHEACRALATQARTMISELRNPTMDQPLIAYLRDLAERFERETGIRVSLQAERPTLTIPAQQQYELTRIIEEALWNVRRHSEARRVVLGLEQTGSLLTVTVEDDGKGFKFSGDFTQFLRDGHYGLLGMHERASSIGAKLAIDTAPGRGTTVRLVLPLPAAVDSLET